MEFNSYERSGEILGAALEAIEDVVEHAIFSATEHTGEEQEGDSMIRTFEEALSLSQGMERFFSLLESRFLEVYETMSTSVEEDFVEEEDLEDDDDLDEDFVQSVEELYSGDKGTN